MQKLIEELEENKSLIWYDDDEADYDRGFNAGINLAINMIKLYDKQRSHQEHEQV